MTPPRPPRIGSLCTGYGGLDLAARALYGGQLAWAADNDPGATAILACRYPAVPNLGDITAINWAGLPSVDILTAGFPCQDLSVGGGRAGLHGRRSGVWAHVAAAIRTLRPRLVLIENVEGILHGRADSYVEPCAWCVGDTDPQLVVRALGAVLGDLAEAGFDAEWCSLRASDVGAPHRRERIFILAWPVPDADSERGELQRRGIPGIMAGPEPAATGLGVPAAGDTAGHRGPVAADPGDGADPEWARRPRRPGRQRPPVRHEPGSHRDSALVHPERPGLQGAARGGADGPGRAPGLSAPRRGGAAADPQHHGQPAGQDSGAGGGAVPGERGAWGEPPELAGDGSQRTDWGRYGAAIARWERVTGRAAPGPAEPGRHRSRLNPRFAEWLMGLDDGWVTGVPGLTRTQQLRAIGNGVVPQQAAAAFNSLVTAFYALGRHWALCNVRTTANVVTTAEVSTTL